jgi:hypothetical protein
MVTFILRTAQERMRSMKERRTKNPLRGRTGHVATARCEVYREIGLRSLITGPLRRTGRSQCRRPRNKGRPTQLRWTLSGEKQPVNAGTYVEGSSLRGKPITNLERRREVDAGHGKPHPQVCGGGYACGDGCVWRWRLCFVGCVWCGGCRPLSKPASDDGPAFARADDQMARW